MDSIFTAAEASTVAFPTLLRIKPEKPQRAPIPQSARPRRLRVELTRREHRNHVWSFPCCTSEQVFLSSKICMRLYKNTSSIAHPLHLGHLEGLQHVLIQEELLTNVTAIPWQFHNLNRAKFTWIDKICIDVVVFCGVGPLQRRHAFP